MNVVGKVGSFITKGVYSVAIPFHPFGGAVDIIVVQQQDGSFRSAPWYVRFGKFQGVLKVAEKVVRIEINGIESKFHMYIDNSGEAYFVREVVPEQDGKLSEGLQHSDGLKGTEEDNRTDQTDADISTKDDPLSRLESYDSSTGEFQLRDEHVALGVERLERTDSDAEKRFYDFPDVRSSFGSSTELAEYDSSRYENLDMDHVVEAENLNSEVVLVSVDGHILTAPILSSERNADDVELDTPQFHLGPGEGTEEFNDGDSAWAADYLSSFDASMDRVNASDVDRMKDINAFDLHSEVYLGDACHLNQVEEIQDTAHHVTENLNRRLENTSSGLKKEDVYKSCLELSTLAMQAGNASSQDVNSPVEVIEAAEDLQDKSLHRSLSTDETEDAHLAISPIGDEMPSPSSGTPSSVAWPDLQIQAESVEENALDTGVSGSDGTIDRFIHTNENKEEEVVGISSKPTPACDEEIVADDDVEPQATTSHEGNEIELRRGLEISLCRNLLHSGMGSDAAAEAFETHRVSEEEFKESAASIVKNENLVIRIQGKYLTWDKASPIILGMVAYGLEVSVESSDAIPVEQEDTTKTGEGEPEISSTPSGRGWRLWPIPFRRVKPFEHTGSNSSNGDVFTDPESRLQNRPVEATTTPTGGSESPHKQLMRTNVPTSDQIASLNLKEGQNMVTFISFSRVLGPQKVEAHIYLWKWNARIVISDVDGTITNLFRCLQDGKALPDGPVIISPDGLFPSLYREVIRRAPHKFKIACLEDIKALFPKDCNPFYAGFGNRDTDELSYRKIGIPKGKICIINPKGEVAINHRIDVKSYTSLHTLVHDMFPPTSLVEQEDYNSWNYWKMPLPDVD